jgi:uncharacterized protein
MAIGRMPDRASIYDMQSAPIRRHEHPVTEPGEEHRPDSPCIQVCVLDSEDVCTGCGRTRGEIARWTGMTAAEQRAVVRRVAARGKHQNGPHD